MTLERFLDNWTRKAGATVILCNNEYYEDMFDLIDDIKDGKKDISFVYPNALGIIVSGLSHYKDTYLLKDRFAKGTVKNFFIYGDYMVIWIEPYEVKEDE